MTTIQRRACFLGIFTLVMLCLTVAQLWPVAAHGNSVAPCRNGSRR